MRLLVTPQSRLQISSVLERMTVALEILDDLAVPGEIGATLDHAIVRLRELLGQDNHPPTGVNALIVQLELELSLTGSERGVPNPWEIPPV